MSIGSSLSITQLFIFSMTTVSIALCRCCHSPCLSLFNKHSDWSRQTARSAYRLQNQVVKNLWRKVICCKSCQRTTFSLYHSNLLLCIQPYCCSFCQFCRTFPRCFITSPFLVSNCSCKSLIFDAWLSIAFRNSLSEQMLSSSTAVARRGRHDGLIGNLWFGSTGSRCGDDETSRWWWSPFNAIGSSGIWMDFSSSIDSPLTFKSTDAVPGAVFKLEQPSFICSFKFFNIPSALFFQ